MEINKFSAYLLQSLNFPSATDLQSENALCTKTCAYWLLQSMYVNIRKEMVQAHIVKHFQSGNHVPVMAAGRNDVYKLSIPPTFNKSPEEREALEKALRQVSTVIQLLHLPKQQVCLYHLPLVWW